MPQLQIVPHEDGAAVVIPTAILESIGLHIGDAVDLTVRDRQVILQSMPDAARRQLLAELTREVFDHRGDAYQRLA